MRTFKIAKQSGLLKFSKIRNLIRALNSEGKNAMALLSYAAKEFPQIVAIRHTEIEISYPQLFERSQERAQQLSNWIASGEKVALIEKNTPDFVITLFALSRLGCSIYLINYTHPEKKIQTMLRENRISKIIHNEEGRFLDFETLLFSEIGELLKSKSKLEKQHSHITVLTSGSTGSPKMAKRKLGIRSFLPPLLALLDSLELKENEKVCLSIPFFHGFGLAGMFMSVLMGAEIRIKEKFTEEELIKNIEKSTVWIAVPSQIFSIRNELKFRGEPLKIISGGARLDPRVLQLLNGNKNLSVFNLYGTSEVGFVCLACPKRLKKHPESIGKVIKGASYRIAVNGELFFKNKWSIKPGAWLSTGDLAENKKGYLFLKGRSDQMIVSGGENVYPIEIEKALNEIEDIEDFHLSVQDHEKFGQSFKLQFYSRQISSDELKNKLTQLLPNYAVPKQIVNEKISRNILGKVEKKD